MKVLVTGGGGFLGRAIVQRLRERGITFARFKGGSMPTSNLWASSAFAATSEISTAWRKPSRVVRLYFTLPPKWGGAYREFYNTNVVGTRNVLELCRHYRVAKLVYTSSPSVVFTGNDDEGIDESAPYPLRYLSSYPKTKAEAERLVLAANSAHLATIALRPHLIWGPGDTHIVPHVLKLAQARRLRLVGDGRYLVDSTYIDNAAAAHLLTVDRLTSSAPCGGRAYFITNGEPLPIAELLGKFLRATSLTPEIRSVRPAFAYFLGAVLENLHRVLRLSGEPLMTRFVARELATAHWFDISAARKDLGYEPAISIEEGMNRLGRSLQLSASVAS